MGGIYGLAWLVCLSGCQLVFSLSSPAPTDATDATDAPDPGVAACPTAASSLVDPLRGSLGPGWETFKSMDNPSLSAVPDANGLVLTPGIDGQIGIYSLFAYDLERSRFGVRLVVDPVPSGENRVQFGLLEPGPRSREAPGVARSVEWTFENATLVATYFDGVARRDIAVGMPYDPALHQYLGFSHNDDTLRWEYSADGTTFLPAFEQVMPAFRMVRPYMRDIRADTVAAPVVATFSDLNSQITRAEACPASSLQSTFDQDDTFAWQPLRVDGCKIEVTGAVTMTGDQAPNYSCEYASTGLFQLIGSSFDIALRPFAPTIDGAEQYVDIESITRARITLRIYRENGILKIGGLALPEPEGTIQSLFDAPEAGERFLRFTGSRDLNGMDKLTLFTSQDGVNFAKRGEFAGLEGFDRSRVVLGGIGDPMTTGAFGGGGTPP